MVAKMLIKEKINQAKEILKEMDIDCWLTFVRESSINGDPALSFLASADVTWHSSFIVTKSGHSYAVVGRYDKKTVEETGAYDEVFSFVSGFSEPLLKLLKEINPSKIAINYSTGSEICDGITYGMYLTLVGVLKTIGFEDRLVSAEKIVSALRQRKTEYELENMRKAIYEAEDIFKAAAGFIKPGVTEKEIASFMQSEVKRRGLEYAWEEATCPSVFSGPDNAEAHYTPTDQKVKPGHLISIDFGVKVNGYCSDLQRNFYVLRENEDKAPAEVLRGFNTIVETVQSAKDGVKPGRQGLEIDKIARDIVAKNGYEDFPFGLGHQVGMYAHDGTALFGPAWEKYANKPFETLEKGMVFTIEPRVNVKDHGIASIEEMIIITENGADWLSHPQKELVYIR
jgi:Xaa-Pro aminopeptidase